MPYVTMALGSLLLIIGVGFYVGTGATSITALIPAFLGVPIEIAGVAALVVSASDDELQVVVPRQPAGEPARPQARPDRRGGI